MGYDAGSVLYCLGGKEVVAENCPTCGHYTKNPLVEMGIVPQRLGNILAPVSAPPIGEKRKSTKRLVKGRVLTSDESLNELKVKRLKTLFIFH